MGGWVGSCTCLGMLAGELVEDGAMILPELFGLGGISLGKLGLGVVEEGGSELLVLLHFLLHRILRLYGWVGG